MIALLTKQGKVKKSTHGCYKEVARIFIQRDAIGTKTVSELHWETLTAGAFASTKSRQRPTNH